MYNIRQGFPCFLILVRSVDTAFEERNRKCKMYFFYILFLYVAKYLINNTIDTGKLPENPVLTIRRYMDVKM